MSNLNIIQHPKMLYISDSSSAYNHLKLFCGDLRSYKKGTYLGFAGATLLYGGPNYFYVLFNSEKCHFREKIDNKNIAVFNQIIKKTKTNKNMS